MAPPVLRLDHGTLVLREVPDVVAGLFPWDAMSRSYRALVGTASTVSEWA
ncbi:hypothetical protein [uncultured Deinococcus sp.]|nr:hypothetical protein [uncultured Deinococcus sp.]